MEEINIKSRERVAQFGEVYTPENIVNDMLDLVKHESYKLGSTFLEPSCGNGNFLVKILERKLETAIKIGLLDYDRNVFIAVSSIYAIDILSDNIRETKGRMMDIIKREYTNETGNELDIEIEKSLKCLMDTNIIWGDGLTGLRQDNHKDIMIAEWNMSGDNVIRKDYIFNNLGSELLRGCTECEYEPIKFTDIVNLKVKQEATVDELMDML